MTDIWAEIDRIKTAIDGEILAKRPAASVTAPEYARREGVTTCLARHRLQAMVAKGHLERGFALIPDPRGAVTRTVVYFPKGRK